LRRPWLGRAPEPARARRAGRAGNKGTAITFIDASEEEERYAPDLVKALKESAAAVPKDLQALADGYLAKRKAGTVQVRRGRAARRDLFARDPPTDSACSAGARAAQVVQAWWSCTSRSTPLPAAVPGRRCFAGREWCPSSETRLVRLARVLAGVCRAYNVVLRTWAGVEQQGRGWVTRCAC